jgi:pimeloyl-ACP methyl ester carboxylesterase
MRRWTKCIFVVLGAFLLIATLAGATYQWLATRRELAATPPPGHLVDIGGYRLHLWCTGDGAPAVILDAGLGGTSAGWGFVQPEVARFTRVCSYDRAGMGYSDPGPSPRTARRIARELAELLARSEVVGPVVLVGESIAGFNVRVFASDHPERAAGLVLVDASHEDDAHEVPGMARFVPLLSTIGVFRLVGVSFGQRVESLAPSVQRYAQATRFRAAGYQAAADEVMHIGETVSEVRNTRRKLTIPVLVVTGARGADENWRRLQHDEASLSERGCLITAQQSGHVIPVDQPAVVVDAIRTVVEIARGHDVPVCATLAANVPVFHLGNDFSLGRTERPSAESTRPVVVLGSVAVDSRHGSNSRKCPHQGFLNKLQRIRSRFVLRVAAFPLPFMVFETASTTTSKSIAISSFTLTVPPAMVMGVIPNSV